MLKEDVLSISEIATECGYNNISFTSTGHLEFYYMGTVSIKVRRVSETVGETNILVENDEAEIYYFTGRISENCADAGLRALTAVQGCRLYAEDDKKFCCVR